jgi:hypothetical protein
MVAGMIGRIAEVDTIVMSVMIRTTAATTVNCTARLLI